MKMGLIATVTGYVAPIFLVFSPILSYTDQVISMYRKRSSAGFSLDIPLIMLVASICRFALRPFCFVFVLGLAEMLTFSRTEYFTTPALDTTPPCSSKRSAISSSS